MKIGIIGGGISGLYSAHLLEKKGHDVTIFEKNNWGGDIQTTEIDGKEYPISTLFDMSNGGELTKELNKFDIKSNFSKNTYGKNQFNKTHFLTLAIYLIGILIGITYNSKVCIGLLVLTIIAFICLIIHVQNPIKRYIYKRTIKPIELSFGACKKCDGDKSLNISEVKLTDIFDTIILSMTILTNNFLFPENCGFKRLVDIYLNNKNIQYINSGVIEVDRINTILHTTDNKYQFDKIIIACDYEAYKYIIPLYENEKELSNVETFKFYSCIAKLNDIKNDIKNIKNQNDILGYFELDKNVYLFASHKALVINKNITYKNFEWDMPIIKNTVEKQKINNINKNIIFIGKEVVGSGVNFCMDYAKEIVDSYF